MCMYNRLWVHVPIRMFCISACLHGHTPWHYLKVPFTAAVPQRCASLKLALLPTKAWPKPLAWTSVEKVLWCCSNSCAETPLWGAHQHAAVWVMLPSAVICACPATFCFLCCSAARMQNLGLLLVGCCCCCVGASVLCFLFSAATAAGAAAALGLFVTVHILFSFPALCPSAHIRVACDAATYAQVCRLTASTPSTLST